MKQYIDKDAVVAEIEKRRDESWLGMYTKEKGIIFDITDDILSFLNTLEVKEANEALRIEYEKGRADVIAKACQFLHDYQEYPDHDIAADKLVEAFKMYIEL